MARDLKAKITLTADTKQAEKNLKKIGTTSKTAFAQVESGAAVATGGVRGLTSGISAMALKFTAAFAAVTAAVTVIKRFINAASQQEAAITKLDAALASLGPTADKVSEALQQQATELQSLTKFGDEETIVAQALIANFVKEEEQIKGLTIRTLDFAEAKGVSLASAADLITKTFASSTNALSRYGIEVTGAAGSTERFKSIVDALDDAFKGSAEAGLATYTFKIKQLSNSYGDLEERIGETGTQNKLFLAGIDLLRKSFETMLNPIEKISKATKSFALNAKILSSTLLLQTQDIFGYTVALDSNLKTAGPLVKLWEKMKEGLKSLAVVTGLVTESTLASAEAFDKQAESAEKAKARTAEIEDSVSELDLALQKLGITTRTQLEAEVALAQVRLGIVREGLREQLTTEKQLTEAEIQLAQAKARLRGESEEAVVAIRNESEAHNELSEIIDTQRQRFESLTAARIHETEEVERNTQALNRNNAANLIGGKSQFAQIGGGMFTINEGTLTGANGRVFVVPAGPSFRGITLSG